MGSLVLKYPFCWRMVVKQLVHDGSFMNRAPRVKDRFIHQQSVLQKFFQEATPGWSRSKAQFNIAQRERWWTSFKRGVTKSSVMELQVVSTSALVKKDHCNRIINRNGLFLAFSSSPSSKPSPVKDIDADEGPKPLQPASTKLVEKENVWTIPNILCFLRMGMSPVLAYMILNGQFGPAVAVFGVAGVTDLLDGWIARVVPGQSSVMGSFLDPIADKMLVGTLFLSLTYIDLIPVPLTCLILGRDAILIAFGFYIRFQSLDPPRTLTRYFNVTYPTAQLAPTMISKINTGIQLGLGGVTLLSTVLPYNVHPFLEFLWYLTGTTTVVSAVSYCFAKDTVKLLRRGQGGKLRGNKP